MDFAGACAGIVVEGEPPPCEAVMYWAWDVREVQVIGDSVV